MESVGGRRTQDGDDARRGSNGDAMADRAKQTVQPQRHPLAQIVVTSLVHYACAHYPVHPDLLKQVSDPDD